MVVFNVDMGQRQQTLARPTLPGQGDVACGESETGRVVDGQEGAGWWPGWRWGHGS